MSHETLEQLQKDFEQFAHTTSHFLKDPLREVVSVCNEDAPATGMDKNIINKIKENVEKVIARIEVLREYSYLFKDDPAEKELIDCNKLIGDIIAKLKEKIEKTNVKIEYHNLPSIKGNLVQIEKLFLELIKNSLDFTNDVAPYIEISGDEKETEYLFCIKDNGVGIDPLYESFIFVLSQSLNPEAGRLGMGLAFAKKVVENHGGKIWFESEEGKGATFFFTIKK